MLRFCSIFAIHRYASEINSKSIPYYHCDIITLDKTIPTDHLGLYLHALKSFSGGFPLTLHLRRVKV